MKKKILVALGIVAGAAAVAVVTTHIIDCISLKRLERELEEEDEYEDEDEEEFDDDIDFLDEKESESKYVTLPNEQSAVKEDSYDEFVGDQMEDEVAEALAD